MKKANEGLKGHFEGQRSQVQKINDFSLSLGLLGISNHVISVFWSFKAIKAKKAAPLARKAKSHKSTPNYSKWLS